MYPALKSLIMLPELFNLQVFLQGMALWASLIIAIGPQNALVIKQGLLRHAVGPVIAVCVISDVIIVVAGTLGIGWLVETVPWLLPVLRYLGVAYLVWFAFTCFRDARNPQGLIADGGSPGAKRSVRGPLFTAIAMTWINPAFYLDGLVMYGGLANQFGDQRWALGAGALTVTCLWFPTLGCGAASLSDTLAKPKVWARINVTIGVVILLIAAKLAFTH